MSLTGAIATLAAVALFCLTQGLFWLWRSRRQRREARLRQRLQVAGPAADAGIERRGAARLGGFLGEHASIRRLGATLDQAGFAATPVEFLRTSGAIVVGAFAVAAALGGSLLSGIFFAALAGFGIKLYVGRRREKRLQAIDAQLAKGLELMMISLRAGRTLEQAIAFAAGELAPPLSVELKRVHEEYEIGRPIETALVHLAGRLAPCRALGIFVEAVLVLKQTGGNLIEILEQIIEGLRAQAAFEIRFRALTAEGRTSGLIIGALPLLIIGAILLTQPTYLTTVAATGAGRWLIFGSASLWLLGVFWLSRLVKVAS